MDTGNRMPLPLPDEKMEYTLPMIPPAGDTNR